MIRALALAIPRTHARLRDRIEPYRPALELTAVALTAAAHLAWPSTGLSRALLVVPLVLGWLGYVVARYRQDPDVVRGWGLGLDGLAPASAAVGLLMLASGPVMIGIGWALGHPMPPATWLVAWCLYPVWGLVQQLLVQSLFAGNWSRLPGRWGSPAVTTIVTATLFGAVHGFDAPLVPATFLLGLVLTPMFLRWRSLWPLAIAHGWLGTLMYFVVLGRNPLEGYLP